MSTPSDPPKTSPAAAAIRATSPTGLNSLTQPGTSRRPSPAPPILPANSAATPAIPLLPGEEEVDEQGLIKRTFQYPAHLLELLANVAYWSRNSQAELLSDILEKGLQQMPEEWQKPRPAEAREGGRRRRRRA